MQQLASRGLAANVCMAAKDGNAFEFVASAVAPQRATGALAAGLRLGPNGGVELKVNEKLCLGCGRCQPYCTMGAIGFVRDSRGRICSSVDQYECVDCGVCYRARVCAADALYEPKPEWPRSVRGTFSNPLVEHKETRVPGRGTEEMKTNDVTGRFKWGEAGMAVEMGRPGVGARFTDIEKVAMAIAAVGGITFEPKNPLTGLMADKKTGKMNEEVMGEKVLSAIIEIDGSATEDSGNHRRRSQGQPRDFDGVQLRPDHESGSGRWNYGVRVGESRRHPAYAKRQDQRRPRQTVLRRGGKRMTHTLHRRGTAESFKNDYVLFAMSAKGVNEVGSKTRLKRFLEIIQQHNPVNMGDMKTGNSFITSRGNHRQ